MLLLHINYSNITGYSYGMHAFKSKLEQHQNKVNFLWTAVFSEMVQPLYPLAYGNTMDL
jgi:hypothetical protein